MACRYEKAGGQNLAVHFLLLFLHLNANKSDPAMGVRTLSAFKLEGFNPMSDGTGMSSGSSSTNLSSRNSDRHCSHFRHRPASHLSKLSLQIASRKKRYRQELPAYVTPSNFQRWLCKRSNVTTDPSPSPLLSFQTKRTQQLEAYEP